METGNFDFDQFLTKAITAAAGAVLLAVIVGFTTCAKYDRDREAACASAGGELRVIGGGSMQGCYRITAEPIPMPNVRRIP